VIVLTFSKEDASQCRHIGQYLNFQGILEFVGGQLVASSHDHFIGTYEEENNLPIRLLMPHAAAVSSRAGLLLTKPYKAAAFYRATLCVSAVFAVARFA